LTNIKETDHNEQCPLCQHMGITFYKNKKQHFYACNNCLGIYVGHDLKPTKSIEKARYEDHNNDIENKGYQNFVQPIVKEIINNQKAQQSGLDYGSGTGPVISNILQQKGFNIELFDPFFYPNYKVLSKKYDFIICCEVVEHFYKPYDEFIKLKKLLNQGGKIYIMTDIYNESIDFKKWYYKNDITHVFIYHKETLKWITENINFTNLKIENRLIIFST